MLNKVTALMSAVGLVFSLSTLGFVFSSSTLGFAQGAAKEARAEGWVAYIDKDKSIIAVRAEKSGAQTTVHYDPSTQWVSQFHGSKKVNTIDPGEVKEHDYVICVGSYDDNKEFHAIKISKRLSHSQ
jgi:hypothetical protein